MNVENIIFCRQFGPMIVSCLEIRSVLVTDGGCVGNDDDDSDGDNDATTTTTTTTFSEQNEWLIRIIHHFDAFLPFVS